jgi:hypothetical protein
MMTSLCPRHASLVWRHGKLGKFIGRFLRCHPVRCCEWEGLA